MERIEPNRSWTPDLDRRAREIAWLVLDVDGVMTDGRLHLDAEGERFKSFDVRDGLAVKLAREAGLRVAILSARESEIVARRAREVGIEEVVQGAAEKRAALAELLARHGAAPRDAAYVGDDLQDLGALRSAGLSAAPADAATEVLAAVDYVCARNGGRGCVRELVERLLVARGAWAAIVDRFSRPPESGSGPSDASPA